MKTIFFLVVGLYPLMFNAMQEPAALTDSQRTNIHYARLAQAIKARIFELKDELNRDKAGHLYLSPHDMLCHEKNQTKSGIFLECEYGLPRALHLPYGRWQIVNEISVQSGYDTKLMEKLLKECQLELVHQRSRIEARLKDGTRLANGPMILIYAVHKIGHTVLEKGSYKDQTEYMDDKHARMAWKALITE